MKTTKLSRIKSNIAVTLYNLKEERKEESFIYLFLDDVLKSKKDINILKSIQFQLNSSRKFLKSSFKDNTHDSIISSIVDDNCILENILKS